MHRHLDLCTVQTTGYNCRRPTCGLWFPSTLVRVPDVAYVYLQHILFLPQYRVSTQWLRSSQWLGRDGRLLRCVYFCAMHSRCLPKTVFTVLKGEFSFVLKNVHCMMHKSKKTDCSCTSCHHSPFVQNCVQGFFFELTSFKLSNSCSAVPGSCLDQERKTNK